MKTTLEKLTNGQHVTIVALGDSITEQTFHTQGHQNWVGLLDEAIFEEYGNGVCTLINAGKCGSSMEDALSRLQRDVLRFDPDLVIIALGMNDATRGPDYLPQFRQNLQSIIDQVSGKGSEILLRTPNPVVTVHGLPLPAEQPEPGKAWESPQRPLATFVDAILEIAATNDLPVVDHYRLWTEADLPYKHPVANPTGLWPRMSDAIHPGALGHLAFFRELAPFFKVSTHFPWE